MAMAINKEYTGQKEYWVLKDQCFRIQAAVFPSGRVSFGKYRSLGGLRRLALRLTKLGMSICTVVPSRTEVGIGTEQLPYRNIWHRDCIGKSFGWISGPVIYRFGTWEPMKEPNRSEEQSNRKQGMAKRRRNSTQPSSSRGNDDANDANWLHNDFENQDYGEDEFIDETPRVDVISDDSGEENIPKRNPNVTRNNRKLDQADLRKRINPARRGEGKGHAPCWVAFDTQWIREEDGVEKKYAECLFCLKLLKADRTLNGTTGLNRHWRSCKANPENQQSDDDKQAKFSFKKDPTGEGHVYTWVHDEVRIAKAVLGIFTIGELPFKWLENEACIELVNALNGRVILPSRHTASRNVAQFKLLKHLSNPNTAVHLTTDTWTSPCQRKNYMVVTAHFIDDDWG
ncbi:hypothetical protein LXL04_026877 [Taraxacum kok-saghyz]